MNFNNNQAAEYLKQVELEEEAKKRAERIRLEAKFDGIEINNNVKLLISINFILKPSFKFKKIISIENSSNLEN